MAIKTGKNLKSSDEISQKLLRLLKPFLQEKTDNPQRRLNSYLMVASSAWNYAVSNQDAFKIQLLESSQSPVARARIEQVFNRVVDRYRQFYVDETEIVLNFEVDYTSEKDFTVFVATVHVNNYEAHQRDPENQSVPLS